MKKLTLESGLNFINLKNIGNKTLKVRNFEVIEDLLKRPEMYTENSKEICDLKDYVDIVNGRNKNFPGPIYMGCDYGTDRTFEWYKISQILKDQAKGKPLTPKCIEGLSEIVDIAKSVARW